MDTRRITDEEAKIILGYEENHFRDLKAKEIAPGKLSQSISAFGNTAGGELYLDENPTITNEIGRGITGLRRDVQMKDTFVLLRKKGLIEQVPGKRGRATAWRKVETPK